MCLSAAPLDDTWTLGIMENTWTQVSLHGSSPAPRVYHSAVALVSSYVIFGGSAVSSGFLNDTWMYNPNQARWLPILSAAAPPARAGHSALVLQNNMVVFGGRGSQNIFDDTWFLQVQGDTVSGNFKGTWVKASTRSAPSPRTGHAAAALGNTGMLVVGGSGVLGKDTIDVWFFDTRCDQWVEVLVSGSAGSPAGRHGHALHMLQSRTMGNSVAYTLMMYGGQSGTADNDPFLNDAWELQVTVASNVCSRTLRAAAVQATWTAAQQGPPPRANMASAKTAESQFLIFGGFAGYGGGLNDRLLSDTWLLADFEASSKQRPGQ